MIYNHISELIGNTPMLKIDPSITGLKNIDLYVKLELFNPFGSVKDRVAWGIIKDDIEEIKRKGKTLIESSSGNTAKGIQALASVYGVNLKVITNRIKIPEVKAILQLQGVEIEELPGQSECPDPTDPDDALAQIDSAIANNPDKYFHTSQYTNPKNPKAHYDTTGKEIYNDLGKVDYIIGTLGTTGSTKGTASFLQEMNPDIIKVGIVSSKGDTIPGIRNIDEMFEVGIFQKDFYNEILEVNSMVALEWSLILIRKIGVLAGPTSGACFKGALDYLSSVDDGLTERKKAVFIACDRMEWYISYYQKRKPELFDIKSKKISLRTLTETDLDEAKMITINEVGDWIKEVKPLIIDLRGSAAFRTSHIENSINIQDAYFEDMISFDIPFSNNQTVLLVCPVGESSKKFAALLNKKGFTNVYSLQGGIVNWRDNGMTLERSSLRKARI